MYKFMSTADANKVAKNYMRFVAVFSQILMVKRGNAFEKDYSMNDLDPYGTAQQTEAVFTFHPGDTFEVFFQVLHYADGWFTDQQKRDREFLFELLPDKSYAPTWTQPMFHYLKIVARTNRGNVDLTPESLACFEFVRQGDQIPFRLDDDEWFELWTKEPRNARD